VVESNNVTVPFLFVCVRDNFKEFRVFFNNQSSKIFCQVQEGLPDSLSYIIFIRMGLQPDSCC
jgi:hypothetical protein